MSRPSLPKVGKFRLFFDRSTYSVTPDGTATVTVSLQETFNPRDEESLLAPGTDGVIRAGVVVQVGTPLPSRPASVRTARAILGNLGFDLAVVARVPSPESPGSAGIEALSTTPVFGTVVSRTRTCETVLLPLGTFAFTAGKVPGEVTFLTAVVSEEFADTSAENTVTDSGVVLDPLIEPGSAMIVVSAKAAAPACGRASTVADVLTTMGDDTVRLRR